MKKLALIALFLLTVKFTVSAAHYYQNMQSQKSQKAHHFHICCDDDTDDPWGD